MPSKAKIKGSTWEREICKELSEVLGGSFVRSNNSGAYIGGINSHRKTHLSENQTRQYKGDIVPPDNLPKMVIEAKNYGSFPFHQLFQNTNCKQIDMWIDQIKETIDESDIWFLIFKITRLGSWILIPNNYNDKFNLGNHANYQNYVIVEMSYFLRANSQLIQELCS